MKFLEGWRLGIPVGAEEIVTTPAIQVLTLRSSLLLGLTARQRAIKVLSLL